MKKIIAATIRPIPRPKPERFSGPTPNVTVTFDDGEVKKLFEFYPDEISFTESEFIGLSEDEARELRHTKDLAYLRS